MFSKKKPASKSAGSTPAMRGRDSNQQADSAPNPLARRFQADSEPDTIDLTDPGRFHAPGVQAEPETSSAEEQSAPGADAAVVSRPLDEVISVDPATGKFYVHPTGGDLTVLLGGQSVSAATELRRGDRIRIGDAEFEYLA